MDYTRSQTNIQMSPDPFKGVPFADWQDKVRGDGNTEQSKAPLEEVSKDTRADEIK